MGARGPIDAQYTRFLVESYDKERAARLRMWADDKDNREQAETGTSKSSKRMQVLRKKVLGGCPVPNEEIMRVVDLKPKKFARKIINVDDQLIIDRANRSSLAGQAILLPDMRTPPPDIRAGLYDGFTKEGKGRDRYLKERKLPPPDLKYRNPLLTSWEYGWRYHEDDRAAYLASIKKPDHAPPPNCFARTRLVADTFYTNNGIPSLKLNC